ncbi:MAG: YjbQ family protein [Deltaproteobacteria bacterium]|nr:YjbQ family protein [Deltaproteobacteria bacterium]
MIFQQHILSIESKSPIEMVDLSSRVESWVETLSIQNGILVVASQHTTMGVVLNEYCEKLQEDMLQFLQSLAPAQKDYAHNRVAVDGRPNAHSHLLSLVIPSQLTLVIQDHKIQKGNWQSIFAVELDGPRSERQVYLTVVGQ